ncbi:MAG: DUF1566 domain-containing protein [Nitrospirae bacterium]|nr:DUF1566 domain-containing protein [Nitrospirota bacterium]
MGYDVFISYDRSDRGFADKLVDSLENRGCKCWIDHRDLPLASSVHKEIFYRITENPKLFMLVLLSANTLQSDYVEKEIAVADSSRISIIPVLIENIKLTGAYAILLINKGRIEAFNLNIDTVAEKICIALKKQKPALPIPSPTPSPTPTPAPTPTPPPKPMPKPMPTRFADNGDGTITDTSTGLMWTKSAMLVEHKTWQEASYYVASMNEGAVENFSYTDWRLPDKEEFEGLLKGSKGYPDKWLRSQGFINVWSSVYWSTTRLDNPSYAWYVLILDGSVGSKNKTERSLVWPVRSVH